MRLSDSQSVFGSPFSRGGTALLIVATLVALGSPNPVLTCAAVLVLPVFVWLAWRPGEPPILLLALGFQWIQVVTKVVHANLAGISLEQLNYYYGEIQAAFWVGLISLIVLAAGMRVGLRRMSHASSMKAVGEAKAISVERAWMLYLAALVMNFVLGSLAWNVSALTQIVLALANMKWLAFFVLAYTALVQHRGRYLLVAALAIEIAIGLGGYFGGFKTVFFVLLIAYATANAGFHLRKMAVLFTIAAGLLFMGLIWTAVKVDYRTYLNQGSRAQVELVSYQERYDKLLDLLDSLGSKDLDNAVRDLADRTAYIDYLSRALRQVPAVVPHAGGELWVNAVRHVFMPRILFPNKPVLPLDTVLSEKYTGLSFEAAGPGTSISMGYVAESYVDFGYVGMFIPIFLLGVVWALIYRVLVSYTGTLSVLNFGLATTVLLPAIQFEINNVKLLGAVIMGLLVALAIRRFVLTFVGSWLLGRGGSDDEEDQGTWQSLRKSDG